MHCKRSIYIVQSRFNIFPESISRDTQHNRGWRVLFCGSSFFSYICCSGDNAQSPLFTWRECFSYVCLQISSNCLQTVPKCCQPTKIKLVGRKNMIFSIDKTVDFVNRMEKKAYFSRYKEALQSWRLIAATF